MGLLDGYADSIERNALSDARRGLAGPAPDPSFSLSAAGASLGKAVPAGLLEAFGAVRDFSSAIDQRHAEEVKAREKRLGLAPSEPYIIPGGGVFRKKADEFAPDPLTAHAAQQLTFGFAKGLTKAGTAMAAAGPTGGALLFGLGEADDTAQRLLEKGIDSSTAWQVGGVVGVTSAIGARLPISGAAMADTVAGKVAATAALGVAGGPVSYMAQEGLSREILQRAGHPDEAKLHDPTNPIGLGASLFPLVLGGFAVRGAIKRIGPVKTEAGVKDAVQLTPAEQAHSDAFERSAGNLAELRQEIARTKDPAAKQVLLAELDKQTKAAAGEVRGTAAARAAEHPEAVDAARVSVLDETVARSLPDSPIAHAEMLRAADMVAAGEMPTVRPMISPEERAANFKAWFGDSKVVHPETGEPLVVYHGTAADFDRFADRYDLPQGVTLGKNFGREDYWHYFTPDPHEAGNFADNADRSNQYLYSEEKSARQNIQAVHVAMQNPLEVMPPADWVKHNGESGMSYMDLHRDEIRRQYLDGMHDGVIARDANGKIAAIATEYPNAVKSATGNSGRFDPHSDSLTDPIPQPAPRTNAPIPAQAPHPEAATPARGAGDAPGAAAADAGRPTADVQAAGVAERLTSTEQQAAQTLAEQHPDMPVRLPGDEKSTTLATALERIKEERAYAEQEAELYRVAVQCALTAGAAT